MYLLELINEMVFIFLAEGWFLVDFFDHTPCVRGSHWYISSEPARPGRFPGKNPKCRSGPEINPERKPGNTRPSPVPTLHKTLQRDTF